MLFASKQIMINNRMHSIGRLFAGTIRVGDELYIHDGTVFCVLSTNIYFTHTLTSNERRRSDSA